MCTHLRHERLCCGLCKYRQSLLELFRNPSERHREFMVACKLFYRLKRQQGVGSAHQTLLILADRNTSELRRHFPWRRRFGK